MPDEPDEGPGLATGSHGPRHSAGPSSGDDVPWAQQTGPVLTRVKARHTPAPRLRGLRP